MLGEGEGFVVGTREGLGVGAEDGEGDGSGVGSQSTAADIKSTSTSSCTNTSASRRRTIFSRCRGPHNELAHRRFLVRHLLSRHEAHRRGADSPLAEL